MVEFRVAETSSAARRVANSAAPVSAAALDSSAETRLTTGLGELDRVLGGGAVPGALILLSGDPGIGKSTLVLQAANSFASAHGNCLYVTGEESISQVALRSRRLQAARDDLLLVSEIDVGAISQHVQKVQPRLLVIDSIQAMSAAEVSAPPGSISQVRECAARFLRLAKELGVPTVLVGHVTKDGALAGPKLLEHMVDTVLSLEGDRHSGYRLLRATKNRFGSTDELGLFLMRDDGLEGVPDASAALLAERRNGAPGSAVVPTMEGSRPLLLEVQALVTQSSPGGNPRRSVTGLDYGRACLILAVLEKRTGMPLASADVFINIPGGLRVGEPAADLGVALAVASSYRDLPVADDTACVGEVGLGGEIRSVPQLGRRLSELARQGFQCCLIPRQADARATANIKVVAVDSIAEAFRAAFAGKRDR
jgi:DNA repair protein RadA/Sms